MALAFLKRHITANFQVPNVDLSGRIYVVTGTTVGSLGFEGALHYARKDPARLILTARSQSKGDATVDAIRSALPGFVGELEVWLLDMSSFANVKAFSDRLDGLDRLDGIVLNAGVYWESWAVTAEGYEETLQINVIATGLLALRALPVLSKTADLPGDRSLKPHLVIVASDVHTWAKLAQQDEANIVEALNTEAKATFKETYNISKLLDIFMAREIAKLGAASKVIVTAPSPGLCKSDLRGDMPRVAAVIFDWIAWPTEFGARNYLYAGVADVTSGAYISECEETPPASYVLSEKGRQVQAQIFGELSVIWRKIDPKVEVILA